MTERKQPLSSISKLSSFGDMRIDGGKLNEETDSVARHRKLQPLGTKIEQEILPLVQRSITPNIQAGKGQEDSKLP